MKNKTQISFLRVSVFALLFLFQSRLNAAQPYSYSNYVAIPTLLATPQFCPNDAPITYEENQPTEYSLTGETACGYAETGAFASNAYAAIDSDSFGDTAASGGNGGHLGGFPCGACAALHNSSNGASVTVVIVDECPQGGNNANNCWVGSYHLDIATAAYSTLSGGGSFPSNSGTNTLSGSTVTWRFVVCPASILTAVSGSGGNIGVAYNGAKSGYNPIMFANASLPIKSVGYSTSSTGPFAACSSDAGGSNNLPFFWGGNGNPTYSSYTSYFQLTSYESGLAPVTVFANSGQWGPNANSGQDPWFSTSQFASCVTGPTSTHTNTPVPGTSTQTYTPTRTPTVTATPTATPTVSGCESIYYNGDTSTTDLSTIKTWTSSATDTELQPNPISFKNGLFRNRV